MCYPQIKQFSATQLIWPKPMRKPTLRAVACGERWRSPQVDEGLVAAPEHVCLAACPKSSTCQRARRAQHPVPRENLARYRGRHAPARRARAARALPPTLGHVHSTGRAVHAGRAARHMLPGHGQGCAALHEHPVWAGAMCRYQYCSAEPRARPPAASRPPPRARAHTHAHTRAHAHAHGAQPFACPMQSPTPRVRLPTRASPHEKNRSLVLLDPIQRAIPPSPRPPPPPLARHTRACSRRAHVSPRQRRDGAR